MSATAVNPSNQVFETIKELVQNSGEQTGQWGQVISIDVIPSSGRNNRIYQVRTEFSDLSVKHYFSHPKDLRDRQGREYTFSQFAWRMGASMIPQPLAMDRATHMNVFKFVTGHAYSQFSDLTQAEFSSDERISFVLESCLKFFETINQHRHMAKEHGLPQTSHASEACFSFKEHDDCVRERVMRLLDKINPTDFPSKDGMHAALHAKHLVQDQIAPLSINYRHALNKKLGMQTKKRLEERYHALSPSDFGLHNCLFQQTEVSDQGHGWQLIFHDFEYAGWDDPAKMLCDFFCQPQHPIPIKYLSQLSQQISFLMNDDDLVERVRFLYPMYELKWACMVLNEFLPEGKARREFSGKRIDQKRLVEQLKLSEAFISSATNHMQF